MIRLENELHNAPITTPDKTNFTEVALPPMLDKISTAIEVIIALQMHQRLLQIVLTMHYSQNQLE